jgi:hypothetical protein
MATSEPEYVCAGLEGRPLEPTRFDLGDGVVISKTFTHLMAPLVAAFAPAQPGKPHPTPWKAVRGGFGFDILSEVKVSTATAKRHSEDPNTTLWSIVALIRLRNGPGITMPAITTVSFTDLKKTGNEVEIWPIEIEPRLLSVQLSDPERISELDLAWVRKYWPQACRLLAKSPEFSMALQTIDQCVFLRHAPLALLSLWAALEGIFSGGRDELRYRISAGLASFLEPSGLSRLSLQKEIAKLYDSRSAAAHGRFDESSAPLSLTYALARRAVIKIIEDEHVPTRAELEAKLFGADL